jgi:hypothetical protein
LSNRCLACPPSELIWQLRILRTALPTAAAAPQMVKHNRRLLQRVASAATTYHIGPAPLTKRDWEQHFGARGRASLAPSVALTRPGSSRPARRSFARRRNPAIRLPAVVLRSSIC